MPEPDAATALRDHVAAFNDRDLGALMRGFTDDAVWISGTSVVRGRADLTTFFGNAMTGLLPRLTILTLIAEADSVVCQMSEVITVDGEERTFAIAGFYRLHAGLISSAKIYREGSAEVE